MNILLPPGVRRFVAIDSHKHYVVVAAVNAQKEVVLKPVRVELPDFEAWALANLLPTDAVVIESTSNAWHLHDLLSPIVAIVLIADARKIVYIAHAKVKTDARDAIHLAQLLAAGMIPTVWVPPVPIRDLRGIVAHRRRLISARVAATNRLHAVLQRHAVALPEGALFGPANRAWWLALKVTPFEQLRVAQDLSAFDHLQTLIDDVEVRFTRLSTELHYRDAITRLLHLPGIAVISAMTILAAIGDIARFESAKKLVGYSGLGAGVHDSGKTLRQGRITKQGRVELRHVLIEASWVAVDNSQHWKTLHARLSKNMHPNKAIVAVARHLLVAIWHVWHEQQSDLHGDDAFISRKLLSWSEKLDRPGRAYLSTGAFVRNRLDFLARGQSLEHIQRGPNRTIPMPPSTLRTSQTSNSSV
jgi:transposase